MLRQLCTGLSCSTLQPALAVSYAPILLASGKRKFARQLPASRDVLVRVYLAAHLCYSSKCARSSMLSCRLHCLLEQERLVQASLQALHDCIGLHRLPAHKVAVTVCPEASHVPSRRVPRAVSADLRGEGPTAHEIQNGCTASAWWGHTRLIPRDMLAAGRRICRERPLLHLCTWQHSNPNAL